jgi:hypothetical protein
MSSTIVKLGKRTDPRSHCQWQNSDYTKDREEMIDEEVQEEDGKMSRGKIESRTAKGNSNSSKR